MIIPMSLEVLIARWVALSLVVFGVSHAAYPREWTGLIVPLRERESGGGVVVLGLVAG